jgi:hypothetical protein
MLELCLNIELGRTECENVSPSLSLGPKCAVEGREQARRLPSH